MKTASEQFTADRLAARAKFLYELADTARQSASEAADAYATCKGDATEVSAAFKKMKNLQGLFGEASRLAYEAEVRAALYR